MSGIVAVIGGGSCSEEDYDRAREVGRRLAEGGYSVLTGGLGGVMEAASRGAKEAGGLTIGVLPGVIREEANSYVDLVLTSGLSDARNVIVATSGVAVVAVGGSYGTLSEIAFALMRGVPVIGLGTWSPPDRDERGRGVRAAETPEEAVGMVESLAPRPIFERNSEEA